MKLPQLNSKNLFKLTVAWLFAGSLLAPTQAAEDDLYDFLWLDPDKKVYVLQNKVYKKAGKGYANIGYSFGLDDNYQDTTAMQFAAGYYFHEEWAVELLYHQYSNSNNESFDNLQRINGSVPFIRKVNKKYGVLGVWSPFYGKINTFNKIIYFDWSFGFGLGQIQTESNALTVSSPSTANIYNDEDQMALLGKTAFRIHATENFHVGLEYHRDHYRAPGPAVSGNPGIEKWRSNSEFVISIGFSF
jgi:outer membrane beta-barrel protein